MATASATPLSSSSQDSRRESLPGRLSLSSSSSSQIHAPLLVGLLCFVIQFWRDQQSAASGRQRASGRREGGGGGATSTKALLSLSVLESLWKKKLLRGGFLPLSKPWLVKVLLWIEQRSKSVRQSLLRIGESDARDDDDPRRQILAQPMSPPRPLIMAGTCSPSVRRLSVVKNELFAAPNCSPILPKRRARGAAPTLRKLNDTTDDDDDDDDDVMVADDGGSVQSATEPPSSEESAPTAGGRAPINASEPALSKRDCEEDPESLDPPDLLFRASPETDDWEHINRVLAYWFGQGRPEISQRQLWMIAAQSASRRAAVDAAIAESFGGLLWDLAQNRRGRWTDWTGCPWDDPMIGPRDNGASVASRSKHGAPPEEGDRLNNRYGYQGKIAAIVVLDQFSRHILRHLQSDRPSGRTATCVFPSQSAFDSLAYRASIALLERHASELDSGMVPTPMHIFALMPLRHANTLPSTARVQEEIRKLDELVRESEAMVRRFRTATNRRMAVLQDEARRVGGGPIQDTAHEEDDEAKEYVYTDEKLLECAGFSADLTPSQNHPVHQCLCAFLANRGIHASSSSISPVVVSLSGGVDSMVIASVLSYIAQSCRYRLKIIAVHIDYGNRPESAAEADFVRRFCDSLGNVEFIGRRIDEVTRGVTARDEYEKISRTVRYEMYRKAIQQALRELEGSGEEPYEAGVGVFLGHHRGDLRENVLSNAHRGCGPLDLSGMTSVSQNDGVTLYRPLLPLEKTAIFDYAHRYGVPYFKDTTPNWSTRGKLRNKLIPLLEEIYGEGSMNNLSNLAVESDSCRCLVHDIAFKPFLAEVRNYPLGISICTKEWKDYDLFFWKIALREALHGAGLGMFSEKSITSFLERVRAPAIREGWLQCRKDYAVYLRRDGWLFVFYPDSFPWHRSSESKQHSLSVHVGASVLLGQWQLSTIVNHVDSPVERASLLNRKAVPEMETLMSGLVEYYVEARTFQVPDTAEKESLFQPRPLVLASFTKVNRPHAWKGADAKVQEALPLICCDETSTLALKDPNGCGAVHKDKSGLVCENPIVVIKVTLQATAPTRRGDTAPT